MHMIPMSHLQVKTLRLRADKQFTANDPNLWLSKPRLVPSTSLSSPQQQKTLWCPASTNNLEIPVSWRPNGDSDQNVTRAPCCDGIWGPQASEGAASSARRTGLPWTSSAPPGCLGWSLSANHSFSNHLSYIWILQISDTCNFINPKNIQGKFAISTVLNKGLEKNWCFYTILVPDFHQEPNVSKGKHQCFKFNIRLQERP